MARRPTRRYPVLPLVVADTLMLVASFVEGYTLRFRSGLPVPKGLAPLSDYMAATPYLCLVCFLSFWAFGLYSVRKREPFPSQVPRIVKALSLSAVVLVGLTFFRRPDEAEFSYSRYVVLLSWGLGVLNITLARYVLLKVLLGIDARNHKLPRMIVLGTGHRAKQLCQAFQSGRAAGYTLAGFVRTNGAEPRDFPGQVIGSLQDLPSILHDHQPDEVLLIGSQLARDEILDIILECEKTLTELRIIPDLLDMVTSSVHIEEFFGFTTMGLKELPLDKTYNRFIKRGMDVGLAALGLAVLSPFLVAIAWCVRRASPGPALYSQERVGQDGTVFRIYKFRSMVVDAEARTGPVMTSKEDPRRTRLGGFLRARNLDELPQLWNVLKGEMSLVGPRPERPYFVDQFKDDIPRYMSRHKVKSGITGWAQINGLRGNTPIAERVRFDIHYIENWSVLMDLRILFRTFWSTQNAY